jgi:hypothetical protein
MSVSEPPDSNTMLAQFNLLIGELLAGSMQRGKFRPWEIDIILDIENCNLQGPAKRNVLSEYSKAVQAELEKGAQRPLLLSEYLERQK